MDSPKFAAFDISEVTYKIVNDQPIKAFIMVPKTASPGKHPIIAKFHGGGFCSGASLFPDWFAPWALAYALHHSAIILAVDYRLMPESSGLDILSDLASFWAWVRDGSFQNALSAFKPALTADLSKILPYGESAGGSLAIHSGLRNPELFKVVIATYPITDFQIKLDKPIMGAPVLPRNVLDDHLKAMVPGQIVTSAFPPERMQLSLSMAQQERWTEFWDAEDPIVTVRRVERAPYMLVLHGEDDSVVPVGGSIEFERVVKGKWGEGRMELVMRPGEHGFDAEAGLETPWLNSALEKVTELWLG